MNRVYSPMLSLTHPVRHYRWRLSKFPSTSYRRIRTTLFCLVWISAWSDALSNERNEEAVASTVACSFTTTPISSDEMIVVGDIIGSHGTRYAAILIHEGKIRQIGNVDEIRSAAPNSSLLACEDAYISPGFVNAHEHPPYSGGKPGPKVAPVYTNRYQWQGKAGDQYEEIAYSRVESDAQLYWIELRHLLAGTTTIAGNGAVPGLLKNVGSGDRDSGFVYQADMKTFPFPQAIDEFKSMPWPHDGPSVEPELSEGMDARTPYVPHVAEGTDHISRLEAEFFLDYVAQNPGRRYGMIHGIGLSRSSVPRMKTLDVTLVWAPRSNLALYGETVDVPYFIQQGVRVALSTDWSYSGSYNMLESFRCATHIADERWDNALSAQELWRMATENGAYALDLEQTIGALKPGYSADIAIVRAKTDDPYNDLVASNVSDVIAMLVDGKITTGHINAFNVNELPHSCKNVVGNHFVCDDLAKRDFTWEQLLAANELAVPLFQTDGQASCTY